MKLSSLGAATVLASVASGHTIFCQLKTNEKTYPVSHAIRTPTYDGSNDPGLLIDIYNKPPGTSSPYKIPGPSVFTC
ncbi:hypothetical protein F4815DRAFT_445394 [Daldinia loculata]|nr:hypothetical protein F4815DRAFT_445394 [Daldinia loculata]